MNSVQPGQLVTFPHGHFPRMVGQVVRVISDSEPRPFSRDFVCVVRVGGEKEFLKRMSELRPLCDRVGQIIQAGDAID